MINNDWLKENKYIPSCQSCDAKEQLYWCGGDCGEPGLCEDCLSSTSGECLYQKCTLTASNHGVVLTEAEEEACYEAEHPSLGYWCDSCLNW